MAKALITPTQDAAISEIIQVGEERKCSLLFIGIGDKGDGIAVVDFSHDGGVNWTPLNLYGRPLTVSKANNMTLLAMPGVFRVSKPKSEDIAGVYLSSDGEL